MICEMPPLDWLHAAKTIFHVITQVIRVGSRQERYPRYVELASYYRVKCSTAKAHGKSGLYGRPSELNENTVRQSVKVCFPSVSSPFPSYFNK